MYIGHACLCVCLSLAAFPHYCTDLDVTWGNVGVPSSCVLLGRFSIDARFRCNDNIAPNAKCQGVLVYLFYAWFVSVLAVSDTSEFNAS